MIPCVPKTDTTNAADRRCLKALDPGKWSSLVMGCASLFWQVVGRQLAEAVFPQKCRACRCYWTPAPANASVAKPYLMPGRPDHALNTVFRQAVSPFLCPDCLSTFEPVASPLCSRCGVMFKSRLGADHLCGACIQCSGTYRHARAGGIYAGALMALIHQLKYRACLSLIHPLGAILQETYRHHWAPQEVDMILSMPLHVRRLRQRGFNQAQLLVDVWADATRRMDGVGPRFAKPREVLVRSKPTLPQTGLGKRARRRNIRRAFTVVNRDAVEGRRVLLVDDVYTTGATVEEAAGELMRNGARAVDVLTVARTMPQGTTQTPINYGSEMAS